MEKFKYIDTETEIGLYLYTIGYEDLMDSEDLSLDKITVLTNILDNILLEDEFTDEQMIMALEIIQRDIDTATI